jgi:hypothetical protein
MVHGDTGGVGITLDCSTGFQLVNNWSTSGTITKSDGERTSAGIDSIFFRQRQFRGNFTFCQSVTASPDVNSSTRHGLVPPRYALRVRSRHIHSSS